MLGLYHSFTGEGFVDTCMAGGTSDAVLVKVNILDGPTCFLSTMNAEKDAADLVLLEVAMHFCWD